MLIVCNKTWSWYNPTKEYHIRGGMLYGGEGDHREAGYEG
jgi:hypothetical protein